jgi:nucleotidyltransferase/DNA polymerase involved in DNA repair
LFAVIHLPQFSLQAGLRHEPELWAKAVALVDPALSTPRVCDANGAARAVGVSEGLTPTQALARCGRLLIRHRSAGQEAAATDAVLQCAYSFSPNIENTSPGTVTIDLRGLAELRNEMERIEYSASSSSAPEADALRDKLLIWSARLRTALSSLNLQARIGIGPTPNIARHAARWGTTVLRSSRREESRSPKSGSRKPKSEINQSLLTSAATIVSDPCGFVVSLPVAALEPSTDVALILQHWGIHTVGELLSLGQDAVVERLGLEALALFAAASTTALRPLNCVLPAERFEESFEFEHEIETVEPLLFILRRFVDQISQRLELGGLVAESITFHLRLESGAAVERHLRIPQPTRRDDTLFRMLHTHLETLRTDSPIVGVAFQADPTQPEQKQLSLFEAALRDPHQFQETLARLSALVGADRVGTPVRENSHQPDAFRLVPPGFENPPAVVEQKVATIPRPTSLRRFRPAKKANVESSKSNAPNPKRAPGFKFRNGNAVPTPQPNKVVEMLGPLFSPPALPERGSGEPRQPQPTRTAERVPAAFSQSRAAGQDCDGPEDSPRPVAIHSSVANGALTIGFGPWRASGNWWEPAAWERDEWDVQTRDGKVLRLVHRTDGWFVEGIMD